MLDSHRGPIPHRGQTSTTGANFVPHRGLILKVPQRGPILHLIRGTSKFSGMTSSVSQHYQRWRSKYSSSSRWRRLQKRALCIKWCQIPKNMIFTWIERYGLKLCFIILHHIHGLAVWDNAEKATKAQFVSSTRIYTISYDLKLRRLQVSLWFVLFLLISWSGFTNIKLS